MLRSHLCAKRKRDSAQPQERRRRGGAGQEINCGLNEPFVDGCALSGLRASPTPSAPNKVPSEHFFDGAATPPLPRRGIFASHAFILDGNSHRPPRPVEAASLYGYPGGAV